jgi:hypothetical protein
MSGISILRSVRNPHVTRKTQAKRRVFYGRETILWYILLLAIGAGVVFTYGIVDDLFH